MKISYRVESVSHSKRAFRFYYNCSCWCRKIVTNFIIYVYNIGILVPKYIHGSSPYIYTAKTQFYLIDFSFSFICVPLSSVVQTKSAQIQSQQGDYLWQNAFKCQWNLLVYHWPLKKLNYLISLLRRRHFSGYTYFCFGFLSPNPIIQIHYRISIAMYIKFLIFFLYLFCFTIHRFCGSFQTILCRRCKYLTIVKCMHPILIYYWKRNTTEISIIFPNSFIPNIINITDYRGK